LWSMDNTLNRKSFSGVKETFKERPDSGLRGVDFPAHDQVASSTNFAVSPYGHPGPPYAMTAGQYSVPRIFDVDRQLLSVQASDTHSFGVPSEVVCPRYTKI